MTDRQSILDRLRALVEEARELQDPDLLAQMRLALDEAGAVGDAPGAEAWQGMIGRCPALLQVRKLVEKFAAVDSPVLITGESGTGKDLVARAIHALSRRRQRPMIAENCAAIPETLLESTLFGHVKGAFTGAVKDHPGHFVAADKGTLFLDEIGDMPLAMQVKLLRVLQEGEVRPVGGSRIRKVDVRVIAATNQDLQAMVAEGRFREDLFYRLNVLTVALPPLRERGDDVLLLARHFLAAAAGKAGRVLRLSEAAEDLVRKAPWPGNVRQMQNEMQRIAALCDGPEVLPEDFSPEIRGG